MIRTSNTVRTGLEVFLAAGSPDIRARQALDAGATLAEIMVEWQTGVTSDAAGP